MQVQQDMKMENWLEFGYMLHMKFALSRSWTELNAEIEVLLYNNDFHNTRNKMVRIWHFLTGMNILHVTVAQKNNVFWSIENPRMIFDFELLEECVCYLWKKGEFLNTMITSVHTPAEEEDETIKNSFYDQLYTT